MLFELKADVAISSGYIVAHRYLQKKKKNLTESKNIVYRAMERISEVIVK